MGKMNLLKAGFSGKVGVTYGTETKGKQILRVIPFSHTPHNDAQKEAFTAFSCLQRFASPIARHVFSYLPLEAKNVTKLNAVASWLKPLISNRVFSPGKIAELAVEQNAVTAQSCYFDTDLKEFIINVVINPPALDYENLRLHIQCFDETGKCWAVWDSEAETGIYRAYTLWQEEVPLSCVVLLTGRKNDRKYLVGTSFCTVAVPVE